MKYRVDIEYYNPSYSHTETFDNLTEYCTAEEYVKSLDIPLIPKENEYMIVYVIDETDMRLSEYCVKGGN